MRTFVIHNLITFLFDSIYHVSLVSLSTSSPSGRSGWLADIGCSSWNSLL